MPDNTVKRWNLSDEFLLDSAEKRLGSGDYLGALTILNKRASIYEPSADAFALYADVYEALELWQLAADAWFRFLDTCNEADFAEGYEGLAVSFMNLGNDYRSAYYYHRVYGEEFEENFEALADSLFVEENTPKLRLVGDADPETLRAGLDLLKSGQLEDARDKFHELDPESPDYPSAAGLSAMCTLMLGDEAEAERECVELLEDHPENVQALTTYCAVLGARGNKEGAKEVAKKLAALPADGTDDLYRIATALCETSLHEAAAEKLTILKERLPYDNNVLWFHAVACYCTERLEEAIDSLERLTTLYPRKAVAQYYLERLRELRDGEGERVSMTYYYRVPEAEYRTVANFLLAASAASEEDALRFSELEHFEEFLRIAFDEMEGRDEKLQMLAVKVAVKTRSYPFLREILLDSEGDEIIKISALHELTVLNEDNSFGTVILDVYKEFFTHRIEIGQRKSQQFLRAFADVYSKFALLGEEYEGKLCGAAEDIYRALSAARAWNYFDERAELAAVIYREARLRGGERSFDEIVKMFDANKYVAQEILDYLL